MKLCKHFHYWPNRRWLLSLCLCLALQIDKQALAKSGPSAAKTDDSEDSANSEISAPDEARATLECIALHDQSEREKQMALFPTLEASFSAQAEPKPASGADRTRARSRVGLAYDLRSFQRAAETTKIARRSCGTASSETSRQHLLDKILSLRAALKRFGQRNAQLVLQQEIFGLNSQLLAQKKLFNAGLISKREFDAFNETRVELILKKSELDAVLGLAEPGVALTSELQTEIGTFYQSYIVGASADHNTRRLIETALRNELETLLLRSKRNAGDPWNFIVSGGYEALSASIEPPKIPGYFQAELKLNLGSFLGGSTSLEALRENPIQAMRQDLLTQAIRNSLTEMRNEHQTWQENLELTKVRVAEIRNRKTLEEASASASESKQESLQWNRERNRIELESLAQELSSKLELIDGKQAPAQQNSGPSAAPQAPLEKELQTGMNADRIALRSGNEGTILPNGVFFSSSGTVLELRPASSQLKKGQISGPAEEGPLRYATESEAMRMRSWQSFPDAVTLRFRYYGRAASEKRLGSGEDRTQLGVFLLGEDQCNLIYVMLRLEDASSKTGTPHVTVQSKTNPGQSRHSECGTSGYETIVPLETKELKTAGDLSRPATSASAITIPVVHTLAARLTQTEALPQGREKSTSGRFQFELLVTFDNELVWRGHVPERFTLRRLGKRGIVGVRSDNARFEFDVAGRPGN